MRKQVESHVSSCDECQRYKITGQHKHGKLPLVPALRDKKPWEKIQVDCCGPWKVKVNNKAMGEKVEYTIHLLSIVNLCLGWPEFCMLQNSTAEHVAKLVDVNWLCGYP